MKSIEVNNGRQLRLENIPGGLAFEHIDHRGALESRESFTDGEIVMLYNLAHYMKENGIKTAFIETPNGPEDFRIFQ